MEFDSEKMKSSDGNFDSTDGFISFEYELQGAVKAVLEE